MSKAVIDVWIIKIDPFNVIERNVPNCLSSVELARASRFRSTSDHAGFVQRRTALRHILASYLGMAPGEIRFAENEFGKPFVTSAAGPLDTGFNTSCSGSIALVAIGNAVQIGIDVERIGPLPDAIDIASRYFTKNEYAAIAKLDARDRAEAFLGVWTQKEALTKATGRGLSASLDSFDVPTQASAAPVRVPGSTGASWHLSRLEPHPGHVAALAVDRECDVRLFRWHGNDAESAEPLPMP